MKLNNSPAKDKQKRGRQRGDADSEMFFVNVIIRITNSIEGESVQLLNLVLCVSSMALEMD